MLFQTPTDAACMYAPQMASAAASDSKKPSLTWTAAYALTVAPVDDIEEVVDEAVTDLIKPHSFEYDQIVRCMQLPLCGERKLSDLVNNISITLLNDKAMIMHWTTALNGRLGIRPFYVEVSRTLRDQRAYVSARPVFNVQLLQRLLTELKYNKAKGVADEATFVFKVTDYDCSMHTLMYKCGETTAVQGSACLQLAPGRSFEAAFTLQHRMYPLVDAMKRPEVKRQQQQKQSSQPTATASPSSPSCSTTSSVFQFALLDTGSNEHEDEIELCAT